jgi:predicted unusual protein kinase regulating ubiquinone biosynthesis (AarF/ABC1/UbiB family)
MSIRPDVLPPPVLQELSKLQDKIEPFSTPGASVLVCVCGGGVDGCVCTWLALHLFALNLMLFHACACANALALQHTPTHPCTEARAMVEKELGAPIEQLFSEFSSKPIAAASLAQVCVCVCVCVRVCVLCASRGG